MTPDLRALPGGELVMQGLRDLQGGSRDSVAALLVQIGRPRLARAGLAVPAGIPDRPDAELRLYARMIADGEPDPYSAYNALIRRLVSCEAALEQSAIRSSSRPPV